MSTRTVIRRPVVRGSAVRRPLAAIIATAIAVTLLGFVPGTVANAITPATTPQGVVLQQLNVDRYNDATPHSLFLTNGFLDDWAQYVASNFAACKGCQGEPRPSLTPAGSTTSADSYARATGGTIAEREDRIVTDFETYNQSQVFGSDTYAAVGFVTNGKTSYALLVTASYSSAPQDETRVGTVTLPSHVYVGVPIVPVIAGWSPAPTSGYTYSWAIGFNVVGSGSTYTPTGAQVGSQIHVLVSEQNSGYSQGYANSPVSSKILAGKVTAPASVVVFGSRNVGETLGLQNDAWQPNQPSRQWYRNGVAIAGQTGFTYTQVAADRGKHISIRLTGAAAGYLTLVKSSATNLVTGYPLIFNNNAPVVSGGTPDYGQTLDVSAGTWTPSDATIKYQWRANGAAIPGATHPTFYLGIGQINEVITVTVTASKSAYASVARTVGFATDVRAAVFSTHQAATIVGTVKAGNIVSAATAAWNPLATAYSYQWYVDGLVIAGATKSTYKIPALYGGDQLSVAIVGSRAGYLPLRVLSTSSTIAP